ncbi:MAG: hypothetical protein KGJ08_09750, partial [Gammaproteobacteria bacterium]|nr:hypothetical protein [Gammaproteobacteria bacterium]
MPATQNIQLHPVRIPNNPNYWRNAGFVDMVGPMRLPTDKSIGEHIAVWVKIPKHGEITVQWLPDQKRYTIKFPPGTVADRVDSSKNEHDVLQVIHGVADVRGARIGRDGRMWFHDYEPVPGEPKKWLKGYEWLRMDPVGDNQAADSLIKLFYPGAPAKAEPEMAEFRRLNQCGACHMANRPAPTQAPVIARSQGSAPSSPPLHAVLPMTDADGFYQPITVLTDTMVIRNHRPWDLNADDPFITVRCGKQKTRAITHGDRSYYQCANGAVPTGRLDMVAALKHHDPHARQVCKARQYLYEHMDVEGQKVYKSYY